MEPKQHRRVEADIDRCLCPHLPRLAVFDARRSRRRPRSDQSRLQAAGVAAAVRPRQRRCYSHDVSKHDASDFFRARRRVARLFAGGEMASGGKRRAGADPRRLADKEYSGASARNTPPVESGIPIAATQTGLCDGRALRQFADREGRSRRPRHHARRVFGFLSRPNPDGAAMAAAVSPRHRGLVAAERMDLRRFRENTAVAWGRRASTADFARQMAWLYSGKLPATLKPREWTIRFRYPAPIGSVRLHLRSNNGADAFVHSEVFEHQYYRLPLRFAPATILDLGANIGFSAIYFARRYPGSRIACVEPVPDNVRLLTRNLKDNAVEAEVIAAAVDAKDGMVAMERSEADYGHKIAAAPPSAAWLD